MRDNVKIGDTVQYYCPTLGSVKQGVITALDVPVEYLYHWAQHGTVFESRHPIKGAVHPLGVEINNSLQRPYFGDGTATLGGYDKTRVAA